MTDQERTMGRCGLALALCGLLSLAGAARAEDRAGMGAEFRVKAVAQDTDLPAYPGSVAEPAEKDKSESVKMGLWGFGFGFRLAVARYRSTDDAAAVADFYRSALARFGTVLDCSGPRPPAPKSADKDDLKAPLDCADDHPQPGGLLYKAGSRRRQHLVQIDPTVQGLTRYSLVAIEIQN